MTKKKNKNKEFACMYGVTGTETSSRLVETIAITVRSSSASALGMMSERNTKEMKENSAANKRLQFWIQRLQL